jgi:phosphoribosylglycinamide formyltransferase 1
MSSPLTPIVILASGRGSNFEAILRAIKAGQLEARVSALISDKPGAEALQIARDAGIPAITVQTMPGESRASYDERLLQALKPYAPRFLVMAGFMKIVTSKLIEAFRSDRGYARVVNIHPSILPAFLGVNSYAQAFNYGAQVAGVTVHLVEESVDSGPICAQEAFSISGVRSVEEVERRGLEIEHRLYPETLRWVLPEMFEVKERVMNTGKEMNTEKDKVRRLCVCPH